MNEAEKRKATPIFSGVLKYFPLAIEEVARVSWTGNEQHNKGEPLRWAREKSADQMDASSRHTLDYAKGIKRDTDGRCHLAKSIWRQMAQLQLDLEKENETRTK